MKVHEYWVYILECSDASYYVGITNDLDRRIKEHQEGWNETCYTFKRRPLQLRYYEVYYYIHDAIGREKQLKGWTRAKKEALMRGDIPALKKLAAGPRSRLSPSATLRVTSGITPGCPEPVEGSAEFIPPEAGLTMTGGYSSNPFNENTNAPLSP